MQEDPVRVEIQLDQQAEQEKGRLWMLRTRQMLPF